MWHRETPIAITPAQEAEYWDHVIEGFSDGRHSRLWTQHSDRVNGALLIRWLGQERITRTLKTDLFDEAVGHGLYPILSRRGGSFIGIDLSKAAVARAAATHAQLKGLAADARRLPFKAKFSTSSCRIRRSIISIASSKSMTRLRNSIGFFVRVGSWS